MSQNPLLVEVPHKVELVPLVHRTDLKVYVLLQWAAEAEQYSERTRDVTGKDLLFATLSEFVCDEQGNRMLTIDEAKVFFGLVNFDDVKAICAAAKKLNGLDTEQVENTGKN